MRLWPSAVGCALATLACLTAATWCRPASAADSPVHFESADVLVVGTTPAVATLQNDTPDTLTITSASAELVPAAVPAAGATTPVTPVTVAVERDHRFGPVSATPLAPGTSVRISLTTTAPAPARTGWLVVTVARDGAVRYVARQKLAGAAAPVTTGLTRWQVTTAPAGALSGTVTVDLPLHTGSCADVRSVDAVLAATDTAATVAKGTCTATDRLPLVVSGLSDVGTYTGTVKVGSESITVTVIRTRLWIWPVAMILLGLLLALLGQGSADRAWARATSRWLRKVRAAAGTPTSDQAGYDIAPAVDAEVQRLTMLRDHILAERGRWLRWLPWPPDFMAEDRAALRDGTRAVDQDVRDWARVDDDLAAMRAGLDADSAALAKLAPALHRRAAELVGADAKVGTIAQVRAVLGETTAWPAARSVVAAVATCADRLTALAAGPAALVGSDRLVFEEARRQQRGVLAALTGQPDARAVAGLADRVEQLAGLVAQLPPPVDGDRGPVRGVGFAPTGAGAQFVLPTVLRQAVTSLRGRGDTILTASLVAVTVAIAIWTGLSTLYAGKAWGTPVDFLSAAAWGFGASALLTPVLTALRAWGTRARDLPKPGPTT